MNSLIGTLNGWGEHGLHFAWEMFWQSSLLIAALFALDLSLRRKVRAAVRYSLWLVVLIKLLLPPSLALPTGLAWWLRPSAPLHRPQPMSFAVTYGPVTRPALPLQTLPAFGPPPMPRISPEAWILVTSSAISLGLLGWMLVSWGRVARDVRRATAPPEWLAELLAATRRQAGIRYPVRLRLTDQPMSPAVCGLFRPVILLPRSIAVQLPQHQLRAVLLHELFHLKRCDVTVNFTQTLLTIAYFWHPLLWLASARVRRLREEAVDDAVMLALRDDAETYAPTLLEVAKLAFDRPMASLGLVGILEPRNALRQRIARLLTFRAPRRAGLSLLSVLGILTFTALAVPMGEAPAKPPSPAPGSDGGRVANRRTQVATSDTPNWEIEALGPANAVQFDFSSGLATASNGAVVIHDGLVLTADKVAVNQQTGEVIADGAVRIQSNNGQLGPLWTGEHIRYLAAGAATEKRVTAVQDAKALYETGKLDQAETKLKQAIKEDPGNNAAYYYLNLVKEARFKEELRKHDSERSNHPIPLTTPEGRELPVPNPYGRTNLIHTSEGRQDILHKLESIRLGTVSFDNLPLGEVIRSLSEEARTRDPERKGINFAIKADVGAARPQTPAPLDPATGLPTVVPPTEAVDINSVTIKISPALTDLRLVDVLDAIVKVASRPLRYSIEDYAVVFSLRQGKEPVRLYVRIIKVDPTTFLQNLESVAGVRSGNGSRGAGSSSDPQANTTQANVRQFFSSMGVDLTPPKTIFFNDREGTLVVRASLEDLDTIETAVQVLNIAPPQVNIKIKYIELPEAEAKALREKSALTNSPSSGNPLLILREQDAKSQSRKWQSIPEVNFVNEASVTTLSGRQAQIQCDSGPVLDVIANVAADGSAIQMTITNSFTEFLGYDAPSSQVELPASLADTPSQPPRGDPPPAPRFRLQQVHENAIVGDGQTLVLGLEGKPAVGPPRKGSSAATKKHLIIFVTPTVIDPAGNRYHSEDEKLYLKNK